MRRLTAAADPGRVAATATPLSSSLAIAGVAAVGGYAASEYATGRAKETLGIDSQAGLFSTLAMRSIVSGSVPFVPVGTPPGVEYAGGFERYSAAAFLGAGVAAAGGAAAGVAALWNVRPDHITRLLAGPAGTSPWARVSRIATRPVNYAVSRFSGPGAVRVLGAVAGAGAALNLFNRSVSRLSQHVLAAGTPGVHARGRPALPMGRSTSGPASTSRVQRSAMTGSTVLALHQTGGRGAVLR